MIEAVNTISQWAFEQENVKSIIAQTDPSNIASQKILENNNFLNLGLGDEYLNWKLSKK
ncbi:MAG: GNAT family protein [Flavobacterium sp.]|uniref:GNAT family N-acetyltransferase n=1 Tax=Flavobacterium sp. TaxID=239 RepID=UPI0032667CC4